MILYALPVSSYSAKVRMQLELKNIDYEMLPPPGGSKYNDRVVNYLSTKRTGQV